MLQQQTRGAFVFVLALLSLWAGRATPCLAQDLFKPDELSRFDGKTWGGLTIGESSTADIKKMFKTSKGAIRPEGMVLPQPEKSTIQVDVLMNGRGEKSLLNGFRVAYANEGVDLKALKEALKLEPDVWYPRQHFDDWHLEAFPERGIVVFVEGSGRVERIPLVVLCAPFHVKDVIDTCDRQPTMPQNIQDVFPDDKRIVVIGQVHVEINCDKGIKVDRSEEICRDLEKQIWRLRTPREIDLRPDSPGKLNVKLDISFNPKDGKATVTANTEISGNTFLGRVNTTARSSDTYREDSASPVWSGSRRIERTFYDVLDKTWAQMADSVRKQPLPTPSILRLKAWDVMINQGTK